MATPEPSPKDRRCPLCGMFPHRQGARVRCDGADVHLPIEQFPDAWNRRPLEDGNPTAEARHNALLQSIDGISRGISAQAKARLAEQSA